jgi:hypothetical protein
MKSVELQMARAIRVTCVLAAIVGVLVFSLCLYKLISGAFSESLWTESVASYRAPR